MATVRYRALGAVVVLAFWATALAGVARAQDPPPDLSKLTIEELMRVEVDTVSGASKFEQKVTEAPASVTIITAEEIERYGYRTLADILRSVPGMFVDYDRNYSYVGIRGFSQPEDYSNGILLLVDGHRTNDNVYDSPNFGTEFILDVDLIKRVEVIRGPASVLYGSNAFFGVINVVTKRGRDQAGESVTAEAGSLGTYRGSLSYGLDPLKGPEILVSGTAYDSHGNQDLFFPEFDTPANNNGVAVDTDRDKYYHGFASVQYRNLSIEAAADWRLKGVPTASFGAVFDDPRNQTVDWSSFVDLKYRRQFASGWQIEGHAAYDRVGYDGTYVQDYGGTELPPYTLNLDHTRGNWWTAGLDATRTFWNRHRVTIGTDTRFNIHQDQSNNDLSPPKIYFNVKASSTIPAAYIQDEYFITSKLILSAGVRYDHYAAFGGTANPRVALIYTPWEQTTIKLIYGQAFRAPSQYELLQTGNAALKPERIRAPEIDLEHYFSTHIRVGTAAFYNQIDDLVIQEASAGGGAFFANQGSVRTEGIGVGISGKWQSGWEGRLAYTVQDSRNGSPSDPVNNYPKHLPKANVIAPLYRKKVFGSFEGQYVSRRATLLGGTVGGYFVANATLDAPHLVNGLDVSLSAFNLFNRRYQDPGFASLVENGITQDGRTLRLKVTYRFDKR